MVSVGNSRPQGNGPPSIETAFDPRFASEKYYVLPIHYFLFQAIPAHKLMRLFLLPVLLQRRATAAVQWAGKALQADERYDF
ncbi:MULTISPECIES: hypothetical protein [Achromobacter]|uniref:hypothetical protein n=1 Tax=Achromobacter TaxID=222 RepID=UPI0025C21F1C|nr:MULTISPECIES: hypothetical protein [Achromobacter]